MPDRQTAKPQQGESEFERGLRHAEAIAVEVVNNWWNSQFARHGNKGLATMNSKVGYEIEAAIRAAYQEERR